MIRLFTNYYTDPVKERDKELKTCLKNNLSHPLIGEVHLIAESGKSYPGAHMHHSDKRPAFQDFFRLANEYAEKDDISIICNTDIFFNDTLSKLAISHSEAYALSRWDMMPDRPALSHFRYVDSQDAWIFKGPIKHIEAPFCMGIPGCDNRLAHEIHIAGYEVKNPSVTIQAVHLHTSGVRRYDRAVAVVPPPYRLIMPTV